MTKRNQDVKVHRANTAQFTVDVNMADGTPYDPTIGTVLRYRMARTSHATDADALVRKQCLGAGVVGDMSATSLGIVTITLKPEDTDFEPGVYYHELKAFDGVTNADVATAMVGHFIIRKSIPMGDYVKPSQGNVAIDRKVPTRTP